MNGIALLSLLAAVTAPPWQIERAGTADNAVWQIHIDQPLLDQWANAGKNRVPHTTRIELPAEPAVETFLIRFGDKPLGSDWIPLTVAAGAVTLHPQVHPTGCQTEIRMHPAVTRRLKLGGYELRGRLPAELAPQRQLVIQIATAQRTAAPDTGPTRPTPPLKAVTRAPAAFADPPRGTSKDWPPRGTGKDWPPRPAASTDAAPTAVELQSSAIRVPGISAETSNATADLESEAAGQPLPADPTQEIRANYTVPQGVLEKTPEPAREPAIVASAATEAAIDQRSEADAKDADTVRPATYLAEPAAADPAPIDTAPLPATGLENTPLAAPQPAGDTPPDNEHLAAAPQTTTPLHETNPPPAAVDQAGTKPPAQWLLLLGLFASVGLNVFLVINHRTIAGQYRQLLDNTYAWEPRRASRAGVPPDPGPSNADPMDSSTRPDADPSIEAEPGDKPQPDQEVPPRQENESDTQTTGNVANQKKRAVVHRRKKRNQRN